MPRPGNPKWVSLSDDGGESPVIRVTINKDSKAFLKLEAEKHKVSLSEYCRDVLESHIDSII